MFRDKAPAKTRTIPILLKVVGKNNGFTVLPARPGNGIIKPESRNFSNKESVMADYLEVCERAARAGGDVLLQWQGKFKAKEKGPKDLVTEADWASQQAIREIVLGAFPDHDFLGEESAPGVHRPTLPTNGRGYRWVVDPLDGTVNYVHGLPNFAVSIALQKSDRVEVGVVYDPIMDECFSAIAGGGAFLNGQPIEASDCEQLSEALLAASFPANVARGSLEVFRFIEGLHSSQAIRRLGSAALNLCYVACGRLDGYWATTVKIWDVAAGILILQESGAIVTDIEGHALNIERPQLAVAATPRLHQQMLAMLDAAVADRQKSS